MLFKWFSRLLHAVVFLALLYIFSYIFAPIIFAANLVTIVSINDFHYGNTSRAPPAT